MTELIHRIEERPMWYAINLGLYITEVAAMTGLVLIAFALIE